MSAAWMRGLGRHWIGEKKGGHLVLPKLYSHKQAQQIEAEGINFLKAKITSLPANNVFACLGDDL